MKFNIGDIPEDEKFVPYKEEWYSIKEPSILVYQAISLPIGIFVLFLMYVAVKDILSLGSLFIITPINIALLIGIIVFHEFLHAICHPCLGFTDKTVIGIHPQKMVFYAHYVETMSRNRFLFSMLNPFIILSVIPIVIILLHNMSIIIIARIAILNALLSCGDLLGLIIIVTQVPKNAVIKNKGWYSYWKNNDYP